MRGRFRASPGLVGASPQTVPASGRPRDAKNIDLPIEELLRRRWVAYNARRHRGTVSLPLIRQTKPGLCEIEQSSDRAG